MDVKTHILNAFPKVNLFKVYEEKHKQTFNYQGNTAL